MNAPAIDWERITRAALPVETVERVAEHEPGGMTAIHWQALAVSALHPLQLAAVVALNTERLSVKDLARRERVPLANMAYHVGRLREWGLLRKDGADWVRGAKQQFYRLAAVRPPKRERAKAAA
jgi:hypothetical protein